MKLVDQQNYKKAKYSRFLWPGQKQWFILKGQKNLTMKEKVDKWDYITFKKSDWRKKLRKIQISGSTHRVHGQAELASLKCPYYPKQSIDSTQSL